MNAIPDRPTPSRVDNRDWFKRFPTGGTVYTSDMTHVAPRPAHDHTLYDNAHRIIVPDSVVERPTGGGTVYQHGGEESNPST